MKTSLLSLGSVRVLPTVVAAAALALVAASPAGAPSVPPPPSDRAPVWAPDGLRVAFERGYYPGHPAYSRGRVVDVVPAGERPLFGDETPRAVRYHLAPDWSRAAFVSVDTQPDVMYVWPLGAGTGRVLEPTPWAGDEMAWSPDSRRLAYVAKEGGLYLFDTASSQPPRLVLPGGSVPAWSPDGTRLAAVRLSSASRPELVLLTVAGGGLQPLGELETSPRRLVWSPDAKRIAAVSHLPLTVVSLDGDRRSYPVSTKWSESDRVVWTPDGAELVYGSELAPYGLVALDFRTGVERVLTRPAGVSRLFEGDRDPVFSPDGRMLAFVGPERCLGQVGVHIARADGSGRRRLTRECRIRGTDGDDVLVGGSDFNILFGGAGDDRLVSSTNGDELRGGPGDDILLGAYASVDTLDGGPGDDHIGGSSSASRAAPWGDKIYGGSGRDRIFGDIGPDRIYAGDGEPDRIRCGHGHDVVNADRFDRVAADCEVVHGGRPR